MAKLSAPPIYTTAAFVSTTATAFVSTLRIPVRKPSFLAPVRAPNKTAPTIDKKPTTSQPKNKLLAGMMNKERQTARNSRRRPWAEPRLTGGTRCQPVLACQRPAEPAKAASKPVQKEKKKKLEVMSKPAVHRQATTAAPKSLQKEKKKVARSTGVKKSRKSATVKITAASRKASLLSSGKVKSVVVSNKPRPAGLKGDLGIFDYGLHLKQNVPATILKRNVDARYSRLLPASFACRLPRPTKAVSTSSFNPPERYVKKTDAERPRSPAKNSAAAVETPLPSPTRAATPIPSRVAEAQSPRPSPLARPCAPTPTRAIRASVATIDSPAKDVSGRRTVRFANEPTVHYVADCHNGAPPLDARRCLEYHPARGSRKIIKFVKGDNDIVAGLTVASRVVGRYLQVRAYARREKSSAVAQSWYGNADNVVRFGCSAITPEHLGELKVDGQFRFGACSFRFPWLPVNVDIGEDIDRAEPRNLQVLPREMCVREEMEERIDLGDLKDLGQWMEEEDDNTVDDLEIDDFGTRQFATPSREELYADAINDPRFCHALESAHRDALRGVEID